MSRKNWGALGCAAFVGAALAFPVGVMFGGRTPDRQDHRAETERENAAARADFRKVYSPDIHNDPYVQGKWQKLVEELEAQCRRTGERCTEAQAARRSVSERW